MPHRLMLSFRALPKSVWLGGVLLGSLGLFSVLPPLAGIADSKPETLVDDVRITPATMPAAIQPAPQTVCTDVKVPVKPTKKQSSQKGSKKAQPKVTTKKVCKTVTPKPTQPKAPLPGSNRIVLQFAPESATHDIDYRWFTLPNPNRVVVDFGEVTFKTPLTLVKLPPKSLVIGMRAGSFRPGTVRMVLDLEKPARVVVFGIPGNRGGQKILKPAKKGGKATIVKTPPQGPRLVIDVLALRKGEKPTVILPPADVVQAGQAPVVKQPKAKGSPNDTLQAPAPVVPPQVTRDITAGKRPGHATVVLDAGHGGLDPGACGKSIHLCEKNLTLDMVKRVRDELRSDQIDVILTRDTDVFIPLPERPRVAQKNNADLFVSLHADMHPTNRQVKGATVYMVSEKASDREAARLMQSENDRDVMAGVALADESPEVQSILMSLVQRDTLNNSVYLGKEVLDELGRFTEVRKETLMSAGFRVLKSPDVPSILVEMGYLSNPREESLLADDAYRAKLAKTIAKGIRAYVAEHVHY